MRWSSWSKTGSELAQQRPGAFDAYLQAVRPDDLATIIYTSGTTGEPKGVMLTHNNFMSNVMSIAKGLPIGPTDVALSVLPLSHIFERDGFYVFCYCGVSVYYAASFDQVGENLREVAPTVMTAVPRLFEKVYHRIIKKGMSEKGFKKSVFMQSLEVGPTIRRAARTSESGSRRDWQSSRSWRVSWCFQSGAKALADVCDISFPVARRFRPRCLTRISRPEFRSCKDMERRRRASSPQIVRATITSDRSEYRSTGIEIKIAEDGEILVRGPNVMRGYYGQPEATAAVLKDGWFYTGDVGHMEKDGQLYITDRKKDLFKLSNGKYVAPQLIESLVEAERVCEPGGGGWRGPKAAGGVDSSGLGKSE